MTTELIIGLAAIAVVMLAAAIWVAHKFKSVKKPREQDENCYSSKQAEQKSKAKAKKDDELKKALQNIESFRK